jgi:hypothetical protein
MAGRFSDWKIALSAASPAAMGTPLTDNFKRIFSFTMPRSGS